MNEMYSFEGISNEQCPHCDYMNEVSEFKIYICDNCGGELLACSQCEYIEESTDWCKKCPLRNNEDATVGEDK